MNETPQRCGFATIIGAPNAGKSTLINAIVGEKVSIVSSKVQTTRTRVLGIVIEDNAQVIFVDTPGIFKPDQKNKMERAIVSAAWEGMADSDTIIFVVDAIKGMNKPVRSILEKIKTLSDKKFILVLNKIDGIARYKLLEMAVAFNKSMNFDATFMVSALKDDGVKDLVKYVAKLMPEGPYHYPEDQMSDMPLRLLAAEVTREKLFRAMHDEIPYDLTVETEAWEEFDNGSVKIDQVIYLAREGQKKIVLGKGGSMLGSIGEKARLELEEMLDRRVHLKLFIKVRENWASQAEHYEIWGLDPDADIV